MVCWFWAARSAAALGGTRLDIQTAILFQLEIACTALLSPYGHDNWEA